MNNITRAYSLKDLIGRLLSYNPPDRTVDEHRKMSQDIHEAAAALDRLSRELAEARELLGRDIRPLLAGMFQQMPDGLGRRANGTLLIRIEAAMDSDNGPHQA
jgi:hypothetical protein